MFWPALSALSASQTLQLKSSYPASRRRPDLLKATLVMPQMMLSWLYTANSWSDLMSNILQVASSLPVAKAYPFGKNYYKNNVSIWKQVLKHPLHNWNHITLTTIELISLSCPVNVCKQYPPLMSHNWKRKIFNEQFRSTIQTMK